MKIAIIAAAVLALGGSAFAQRAATTTTTGLPAQTQGTGGTGPTSGGIGGAGGGKFGEPGGSATESRGVGASLVRQASPPTGRPSFGPGSASSGHRGSMESGEGMRGPEMNDHQPMRRHTPMRHHHHRRHAMHHTGR